VKTTEAGGERGYDAAKHVNGRKRHILVDTCGSLIEAVVHPADIQDRDGAKLVLIKLTDDNKRLLQLIWADAGYQCALENWVREHLDATLSIVHRDPNLKGFQRLPRRWVVERSLAWYSRFRRLSKDFEHLVSVSESFLYLASIRRLLKRTTWFFQMTSKSAT
jgi:putative transposase